MSFADAEASAVVPPGHHAAAAPAITSRTATALRIGSVITFLGFAQDFAAEMIPRVQRFLIESHLLKCSGMITAITRVVSPALASCELSFIARRPIDLETARAQHRNYERLIESLGARLISLAAEPELPDSMFVEDPAIVLDEVAVIFPLGTASRRPEAPSLAEELAKHRKLEYVGLPGTLEGGDVLRVGKKLFVGVSRRSNEEGIRQLRAIVGRFGYEVIAVPVTGCLHLKSAVTYLGGNTLLANRGWFSSEKFSGFNWIDVDPSEPHSANALALNDIVIFPASFPETRARIELAGFRVVPLDICELQKAESGLTCSSLIFESATEK
jgi:dimethylargininase